jgi:adenylate cyclase
MGKDEAGTLAALKALRTEVIDPKVAEYSGRVFKSTGDGCLAEFPSVVNAVACATNIQREMAERNPNKPQGNAIQLRIGINVGDIVVDDGDVFGDGVNVAARVESIAPPGGIALTETAREHLGTKLKLDFTDTGTHSLKNIERPVRVFTIGREGTRVYTPESTNTNKPSIAILPLVNMNGDPEQQYFSDGITEDIITELSRFRSLLVIARNSSFQYRTATDVKRINRELGVQYLVEGSVRRSSNRLRITAQLVDASGNHLWAEHYDRDMQDIFAVQDELARAIAATIEGRMAASGAERSRRKPTSDLVAYDCFLQGREAIERRGDHDTALRLLRRAVELDPNFSQAHAWLARVCIFMLHYTLELQWLNEAIEIARKAVSLDEADAVGHAMLGYALIFGAQHDFAALHIERAIALNPMDVRITSKHALLLVFTGKGDEAVSSLDADLRRDPFPPAWFWDFRGIALFQSGKYEEAIKSLNHLTTLYPWDYHYLAAANAHLGFDERARAYVQKILSTHPNYAISKIAILEPYKEPADLERLIDGLRKAGLPE